MEQFFLIAISAAVLGVSGAVGWLAVHNHKARFFWWPFAGLLVLSGVLVSLFLNASGLNGIIYAVYLVLGCIPAGIGLVFGGGLGTLTRRRHA